MFFYHTVELEQVIYVILKEATTKPFHHDTSSNLHAVSGIIFHPLISIYSISKSMILTPSYKTQGLFKIIISPFTE